ncbi:ORF35 [Fowl aviadenovirus 2]|uniref:ORF35 n=1 Tax=Fowl aviadenovirus 2 TaxID=172859 RepID=A0A7G3VX74_9ADEN|nr:ORF35 [Fowl aviadenovirus 2]
MASCIHHGGTATPNTTYKGISRHSAITTSIRNTSSRYLKKKQDLTQKKKYLPRNHQEIPLRDNPDLADAQRSRLKYRSLSLFNYLSYAHFLSGKIRR